MSENKQGFYWHVHHDALMEWCYSYNERVEYIRTQKPENEREIRLRLFQPAKGDLPQEVVEAWQAYDKAWQAYDKARQACDKAWQAYDKAWQAYDKARQAYDKAIKKNKSAIEALHAKECPNCPWDGKTIFPNT